MAIRKTREEIDVIMEEMEAITPSSSANISFTFPQANSTTISDDVDAKPSSSNETPPKPTRSNFFKQIFEQKPKKPGQIYPSRPTNERYYDYTNSNIGIAIIFNQVTFKSENTREGSSKDAQDLKNVLSNLGFIVEILPDYTTHEIRDFLQKRE